MPDLTLSRLFCCGSAEKDLTPLPPNSANDVRHAKRRGRRRKTKERKTLEARRCRTFLFLLPVASPPPFSPPPRPPKGGVGKGRRTFQHRCHLDNSTSAVSLSPFLYLGQTVGLFKVGRRLFHPPSPLPSTLLHSFLFFRREEDAWRQITSPPLLFPKKFTSVFRLPSLSFFSGRTKKGLDGRGLREETRLLRRRPWKPFIQLCFATYVHTV